MGVNSYYECVLYLVRNSDQINCNASNRLVCVVGNIMTFEVPVKMNYVDRKWM